MPAGSSSSRVRSHFERLWPTKGSDGIDTLLAEAAQIRKLRVEAERRAEEDAARERAIAEQKRRERELAEMQAMSKTLELEKQREVEMLLRSAGWEEFEQLAEQFRFPRCGKLRNTPSVTQALSDVCAEGHAEDWPYCAKAVQYFFGPDR